MSELAIVAPLGGAVILALFYMRRIEKGAAAYAWGAAWVCLYAGGLFAAVPGVPAHVKPIIHLPGTMFPALLLAGTIAFRDRSSLPRGPIVAGLALGLSRVLLGAAGYERIALLLAAPLELPFTVGAAALMWGAARGRSRSFAEQMLPPSLALLALVNAVDPVARAFGLERIPLVFAWLSTTVVTALLQVAAFVERSRDRERQLLLERDVLHRIARTATVEREPERALERTVEAVGAAQWFDAFGIWLASPDGRSFECAAHVLGSDPPPALARFPSTEPLVRDVLATDEPVRIAADLGPRRSRFGRFGIGEVATASLRAHERTLGIAVAGLGFGRHFDESELRGLGSLAREIALVLAHVDSIATRGRHAAELAAERRRLRAVVESVPLGIMLVDRDDRISMLSRGAAIAHFGIGAPDAWIGRPGRDTIGAYADRLAPESRARLAAWASEAPATGADLELRFERPEERVVVLTSRRVHSEDGAFQGRVFVSRDVTEERRVGEHLQRMQRMETLGALASGIAHDFNNQLTAVLGNARRLEEWIDGGPAASVLADLEHAAEHCAELTRSLLDLARPSPPAREPVPVDRILREVEALLRATLPPDVSLVVAGDPAAIAHAEPAQLRRLVTNLALNARDAVGARGAIELSTCTTADPARVEIGVRDSGPGIDAGALERVFDPFFTTKPAGKGTGLGLAIVGRIAAAHGATIEVDGAPGSGACFRVLWPAATGRADSLADGASPDAGYETVLVAEDDPGVRRLAVRALEQAGHRVIAASNGEEALALFERHREAVALVICDLAMPRRDGRAVLAAVRELAPSMPAILMTGHGIDGPALAGVVTLAKPFRPDELTSAVRRALDRSP